MASRGRGRYQMGMDGLASPIRDALAGIEAAPLLAQVEEWCAVNSGSDNLPGLARVAGLLADAAAALPGALTLIPADPVAAVAPDGRPVELARGQSLLLVVRPEARRRVLLAGHMDTVYGAEHPFQVVRRLADGRVNGPGVADMKGGLAVALAALAAFERMPEASGLGYDLLINADEEVGSGGSARLIGERARGKVAAFAYEPALPDGTLAGARPGSANLSLTVHGRAAHAGRDPESGRNAIVAAADLALRLHEARGPTLSVNPARIDGGGPNNIVPDSAVLRVNLRPRLPADEARARSLIEEAIAAVQSRHDVRVAMAGGFGRPPKPIDDRARRLFDLVRGCGSALGIPVAWRDTGGVCDGNNIAAAGVPVVDTMGVRGGAIHTEDEFLIPDSLVERARLSALALHHIATGGLA